MGKKKFTLFEEYLHQVSLIMKSRYGLDPSDWDDETSTQARNAFDGDEAPDEFCTWYAERYELRDIRDTGFGI